jgi:DNA-binding MarR family transcriptional regulator
MTTDRTPPRAHRIALQGIRALVSDLHRSARAVEGRTGITNAQLFVLQQLAAGDGRSRALSIGELAALAHTTPGAVSTITTRLAQRGLLARRPSAHDARRVELALTPAGAAMVRRAPAAPTAQLVAALAALPPAKLRALVTGINALTKSLQLDVDSPRLLFEDAFASATLRSTDAKRK